MRDFFVISLGGSIVVTERINISFLRKFRNLLIKYIKKRKKFALVVGGGAIAREYIKNVSKIEKLTSKDKDWLGIQATKLNAFLLYTIFKNKVKAKFISDISKGVDRRYEVLITGGWKPGRSTDFVAVMMAERLKVKKIINLTNIPFVYDKSKKPLKKVKWDQYLTFIPSKWSPGMSTPFDPLASKKAKKLKMEVIVAKGEDLKNLEKIIKNQQFKGTLIYP